MNNDGSSEDVFVMGKKPNRFQYSHSQCHKLHNSVCLVQLTLEGEHWWLLSIAQTADAGPTPSTYLEVLYRR